MNNKNLYLIGAIFTASLLLAQPSIVGSKHNLSISGTGDIKATEESEVCIFCHATHGGITQAPLWNRSATSTTYTLYGSPSMETNTQQPGTSSRICLSCHDGTIALGLVINRPDPIPFPVGMDKIPASYRSNLSDNLSDDHPLNIDAHPTGFNCEGCHDVSAGTTSNLECSSCHDPHDNTYGNFIKTDPVAGALCNLCHNITEWPNCSHAVSGATWNGELPDPWPNTEWTTVSENACDNCHTPHGGSGPYWLMKSSAEEDNCLICHNGNVAQKDIQTELTKPSTHPVENYNQIHHPDEDLILMDEHVECSDCHNPHEVNNATASAPYVTGRLTGVRGIDKDGNAILTSNYEYEVCLKCHKYAISTQTTYVTRRDVQSSIRLEFSETNPSYHPVYGPGANTNVPSLISPYTENSIIYCTDCHNNNAASPAGPHGSTYAPLLEYQMIFSDYNTESSAIYASCYECHDRSSVLQDKSRFKHSRHVQSYKAACTTCHDPHGSYTNTHLINFNTDYVTETSGGRLEFIDYGNNKGRCYLVCHGKIHNPARY